MNEEKAHSGFSYHSQSHFFFLTEHKSSIRRQDITSAVARHFIFYFLYLRHFLFDFGHDVKQLDCTGTEEVFESHKGGNLNKRLLQREAFWIHKLKSLTPRGMNEELVLSVFFNSWLFSYNIVNPGF